MLSRAKIGGWRLAVSCWRDYHQVLRFLAWVKLGLRRPFLGGFKLGRSGKIPSGVNAQTGFTLLETVAVVAIAGMTLGVLMQVLIQTTHTQRQLAGRVEALVLGSGKLEELAAQADMDGFGVFPAPYQRYRWSCRTDKLDTGAVERELVVEWGERNDTSRKKIFRQYDPAQ